MHATPACVTLAVALMLPVAGGFALRDRLETQPSGPAKKDKPKEPAAPKPGPESEQPGGGGGSGGGGGGGSGGGRGVLSDAQREKLLAGSHPVVTEILYAVPSGDAGDANGDGKRQATGDEFVELWNPHDKAIELRGYTLTDKSGGKPGALRFVFPACKLAPGQCAVVFNGFESTWTGPVGDSTKAPGEGHKRFGGALVFSMKAEGARVALSNSGDSVCLAAPDGAMLDVITWGKVDKPLSGAVNEEAPITNRGSVQRSLSGGVGAGGGGRIGGFSAHEDAGGVRYSPGRFGAPPAAKPGAGPGEPSPDKPGTPAAPGQ